MLAAISGAESVLELGTFTGYSALCLAEGVLKGRKEKMRKTELLGDVPVGGSKGGNESKIEEGESGEKELKSALDVEIKNLDLKAESESESVETIQIENFEDDKSVNYSARKLEKLRKRKIILDKIENKKQKIEFQKIETSEKLNSAISGTEAAVPDLVLVPVPVEEKRERRGSVVTCEMDPSAAKIASEFFEKSGEVGDEVRQIFLIILFYFFCFYWNLLFC